MKSKGQRESKKHEDRLAKAIGGQRNAGSGAFWSRKGDVRSKDLLIEHKWTGKATVTIKATVLEKIVDSGHPDMAVSFARQWLKLRPSGATPNSTVLRALVPLLTEAKLI